MPSTSKIGLVRLSQHPSMTDTLLLVFLSRRNHSSEKESHLTSVMDRARTRPRFVKPCSSYRLIWVLVRLPLASCVCFSLASSFPQSNYPMNARITNFLLSTMLSTQTLPFWLPQSLQPSGSHWRQSRRRALCGVSWVCALHSLTFLCPSEIDGDRKPDPGARGRTEHYRVRSALLEKAALLSPRCQHWCDFFSWSPVSKEVTALRSYSGC